MKNFKKLFAVLAAIMMVLTMGTTAAKAEGNPTISVDPDDNGTYEVYQIFTGVAGEGKVLTDLKWGQNSTGEEGKALTKAESDAVKALTDNGDSGAKDQLDLAAIKNYVDTTGTPLGTVNKDNPLEVPTGYYYLKEINVATGNAASLDLVKVVTSDITIKGKKDVPSHDKKIKDINDSTDTTVGAPQDSADYDIGDKVPYVLTAKLANNVGAYKKYHITFVDTLEATALKNNKDYIVKINGVETTDYTVSDTDGGFELTLEWGDGENAIANTTLGTTLNNATVTVEFTATLLEGAKIGEEGNMNTSKLKFSNNPNDDDGGDEGETPEDRVLVFTYKVVVNKVDGDNNNQPLAGAKFSLYKKYATAPEGKTPCTEEGYDGYYLVKKFEGGTDTVFTFEGVDDGDYVLIEDEAPKNYNKIDPIEFTVSATHTESAEITADHKDPKTTKYLLTDLSGTGDIEFTRSISAGSLTADVENNKGATLPETGGIGTTIFYTVGGLLVIGAIIMLIQKRRMAE